MQCILVDRLTLGFQRNGNPHMRNFLMFRNTLKYPREPERPECISGWSAELTKLFFLAILPTGFILIKCSYKNTLIFRIRFSITKRKESI